MSRVVARILVALAAIACVVLGSRTAWAHKPSDAYLTLAVAGASIDGRWDIALRDADYAIGLDDDRDGNVTWAELRAHRADLERWAYGALGVAVGAGDGSGGACPIHARDLRVVHHSDGAYAVLGFDAACPTAPKDLDVDYTLLFADDPQHRGLLRVDAGGRTSGTSFSTKERHRRIALGSTSSWSTFGAMVHHGIGHIWDGIDHLLFLLALLLPSVLRRDRNGWTPVVRFRPAVTDVLKIVTAFTVAHSITLSLAALGFVALPSRFVESAIAASVVVAAVNNIVPILSSDRWMAAFALGLLHGFGFSATLIDLGLPRHDLLVSLFGFNLGVEIGQCAVVAAFLPIAFLLRGTRVYRQLALVGGSAVITCVAAIWLVERAFEVRIVS